MTSQNKDLFYMNLDSDNNLFLKHFNVSDERSFLKSGDFQNAFPQNVMIMTHQ